MRHLVSVGITVMVVQDENSGHDGRSNHEHDTVEVGSEQRNSVGGCRHRFGDHVEKHRERQQDGDSERQLLAGVRRKCKAKHGHGGDQHARYDQVEEVVERPPPDDDHERDINIRFRAAVVIDLVSLAGDPYTTHLPRHIHMHNRYTHQPTENRDSQ